MYAKSQKQLMTNHVRLPDKHYGKNGRLLETKTNKAPHI